MRETSVLARLAFLASSFLARLACLARRSRSAAHDASRPRIRSTAARARTIARARSRAHRDGRVVLARASRDFAR
jgi:hypothetical protein